MGSGESSIPFAVEKDTLRTNDKASPQMNFRSSIGNTVRDYIRLYEAWHQSCRAFDADGRHAGLFDSCDYTAPEAISPSATGSSQGGADAGGCARGDCAGAAACSFDIILLGNVLEHVLDPKRTVEAVARALRPGGLAAVWTPWVGRFRPYESSRASIGPPRHNVFTAQDAHYFSRTCCKDLYDQFGEKFAIEFRKKYENIKIRQSKGIWCVV